MQESVTITPTETYLLNSTLQEDIHGTPLASPDPSYGAPVYVSSDPTVAFIDHTLQGIPFVSPTAKLGVTTITATETSSDNTKKVLTGTLIVTVTGPSADSLDIKGVIEGN